MLRIILSHLQTLGICCLPAEDPDMPPPQATVFASFILIYFVKGYKWPADGRVKVQNLSSRRIVEGVVESADVIRITP